MPIRKARRARAPNERRLSDRLPIEQPVRYRVFGRRKGSEQIGSGSTVNMSGSGICFTTDLDLPEGARIELDVNWPATLNGVALKLALSGRVVRAEMRRAAITIEKYEFKTRRSSHSTDFSLSAAS